MNLSSLLKSGGTHSALEDLNTKGHIQEVTMRAFFYYERDLYNRPIITRCFITDGHRHACGAALCADEENPCKKIGREIAYKRAIDAFDNDNFELGLTPNGFRFIKQNPNPILNKIQKRFVAVVLNEE